MLVLALDTATPRVTAGVVQVARPHELIAEPGREPLATLADRVVENAVGHAELLVPLVRAALADAGRSLREVQAVVAGLGPGPFTGLRVGLATAAAFGDALELPVHGVPSHDAVASAVVIPTPVAVTSHGHGHGHGQGFEHEGTPEPGSTAPGPADQDFLVVTDARRREVYVSGYRPGGRRVLGPLVCPPSDVAAAAAAAGLRPGWVTGAGADLVSGLLGRPAVPVTGGVPAGLVRRALTGLLTGAVPGPLEPLYLRRPDATPPAPSRFAVARSAGG